MNSSANLSRTCLAVITIGFTLLFSSFAQSGTKVAFTGDQGTDENARAVLTMIANEGVDLVLVQGDLGYDRNAATRWEANLSDTLGENFPVLSGVGNHENFEWHLYHRYIKNRINRVDGLSCSGNPGVKAHCKFDNLEIVQVSPGIREVAGVRAEDNYPEYINDKFSGTSNKWRICTWHKNMREMQTGEKNNSTGWDVYRSCLNAGALIAVAHEHAYSRTHLMSNYQNQTVAHRNSEMTLEPGKSFMFVSGLGGRSIREQKRGGDWWASIYTASQGATHGALICDFERITAQCYFKAIDGSVQDQFSLRLNDGGRGGSTDSTPEPAGDKPPQLSSVPAVFKRIDSDEYRWIDRDANGQLGNVRIEPACSEAMGGVDLFGDWDDLLALAPGVDAIENPCVNQNNNNPGSSANDPTLDTNYVFQRTDKNELRWITQNSHGQVGSTSITKSCANKLGGATVSGDWFDLQSLAPAFDQYNNPCSHSSISVISCS